MELIQIKEKDNPLLLRKRVTFEGEVEKSTPSRSVLKSQLAKKLKTDEEKIIIRHIYSKFGSKKIKVIVHVYDKKEDLEKIEDKNTVRKNTAKKEAPKAEEAAPVAPTEKAEESATEEAPKEAPAPTPKEDLAGQENSPSQDDTSESKGSEEPKKEEETTPAEEAKEEAPAEDNDPKENKDDN